MQVLYLYQDSDAIASIRGREKCCCSDKKNRVQYARGFTKRIPISAALTSLETLAIATATDGNKGPGNHQRRVLFYKK